jgi:hypothetical protein
MIAIAVRENDRRYRCRRRHGADLRERARPWGIGRNGDGSRVAEKSPT